MTNLVVYKYPIGLDSLAVVATTKTLLDLPWGATLLHVVNQGETPVLYAVVDSLEARRESITIFARMTGDPFAVPEYPNMTRYLDTVPFYNGQFVLHFFVVEGPTHYRLGPPVWTEGPSTPFQEVQTFPQANKEDAL